MMARRSDEGSMAGLGWIDAEVRRFEPDRLR
jgi:imidazoleglycerol phosphate synthase glutamine amidotransferase subunit HisH